VDLISFIICHFPLIIGRKRARSLIRAPQMLERNAEAEVVLSNDKRSMKDDR
jgi:hypothetical protein